MQHRNVIFRLCCDTARPLAYSAFASARFIISSPRTFLKR